MSVQSALPPAPIRLIVFDWDGTLIDSIGAIVECTRAAMALAGLPERPETMIRRAIGMGLRDSFAWFHPEATEEAYERVIDHYRELWLADYKDRSTLFPGALDTVRNLAERGYRLGVATAKSRRGLDRELAKTGLDTWMQATRTVDEAPPKPDPRMLLDLMAELREQPSSTLMVGDTTYDLDMARAAGVLGVGVLSGSHREDELRVSAPRACLNSVVELPAWLDQLSAQAPSMP